MSVHELQFVLVNTFVLFHTKYLAPLGVILTNVQSLSASQSGRVSVQLAPLSVLYHNLLASSATIIFVQSSLIAHVNQFPLLSPNGCLSVQLAHQSALVYNLHQ